MPGKGHVNAKDESARTPARDEGLPETESASRALPGDEVLRLQRTVGNRAARHWLRSSAGAGSGAIRLGRRRALPAAGSSGVIQRTPNTMLIQAIESAGTGPAVVARCRQADEETAQAILDSDLLDRLAARFSSASIDEARRILRERAGVPQTARERDLTFTMEFTETYEQFREAMIAGIGQRMIFESDEGRSVRRFIEASDLEERIFPQLRTSGVRPGQPTEIAVFLGLNEFGSVRRFRFRINVAEFTFEDDVFEPEEGEVPHVSTEGPGEGAGIPRGQRGGMTRAADVATGAVEAVGATAELTAAGGLAPALAIPVGTFALAADMADRERERAFLGIANGYTEVLMAYSRQRPGTRTAPRRPARITQEWWRVGWDRGVAHVQPLRERDPEEFARWMIQVNRMSREEIFNAVYGEGRYSTD
jgi:hypothetical protein